VTARLGAAGGAGRFTTGSTLRHVTVMSLTGSVGLSFMFLVDVATLFWVAQIGDPTLLAGVGIAGAVQFFTVSSGIGIAIATTALVSRAIGRRDRAEARALAASSAVSGAAVALAVALLVTLLRGPIVGLIGAEPASAAVAERFLLIAVPSLPLMTLAMIAASILRAEGDAARAMLVTVSAGVVAAILDPLFIFGLGLGVDGAAWALVLARTVTSALGLAFVIGRHDLMARPAAAALRRHLRPFFLIAGPAMLTQLSTPFGNFLVTGVLATFGDAAVAGWAVVGRLTALAFGGIFALSGAIGGIIGQNHGAGLDRRVLTAYRDAIVFCLVYVLFAWGVLAVATEPLIVLFHVPERGGEVIRAFTAIGAGGFVFTSGLFVSNAAFNALGRPLWSTGFSWLRDGLLVWPAASLLALPFAAPGAVFGQALASALVGVVAVIVGWRFVSRRAM
jgi:putative MATE family efflux protein